MKKIMIILFCVSNIALILGLIDDNSNMIVNSVFGYTLVLIFTISNSKRVQRKLNKLL